MALYEAYLDEDILDETLSDSYDLGDDYDDGAESYGDYGDDFDEAKRRRRTARPARTNWRNRHRARSAATTGAVTSTGVRKAFNNVGQDVSMLRRNAKATQVAQDNSFGLDIFKFAALPTVILDKDGNPSSEFRVKNNLVPFIILTLLGNMIGSGNKLNFRRALPWVLAAVLISPDSLKQLGINTGGTSSTTGTASSGILGNLDTTTLLLIGGIAYFALAKK